MRIIAIANQKGGVGKTTTAVNLAAGLISQGKSVLCLDFDPQCNLGAYLGHKPDDAVTITDLLFNNESTFQELPPVDGLIRDSECGIKYIPASLELSKADMKLSGAVKREQILSMILKVAVPDEYDYLIIDCNPSMGILMMNALAAATDVLIPVQTEEFAVSGLEDMLELVSIVRRQLNPSLQVLGLLSTMVGYNNVSRQIIDELRKRYPELLFDAQISRSVEAAKSTQRQEPLSASSKLGAQYQAATQEIINRLDGQI